MERKREIIGPLKVRFHPFSDLTLQGPRGLKFRSCKKATKFDKNVPPCLKLLIHVHKTKWDIFSKKNGLLRISEL